MKRLLLLLVFLGWIAGPNVFAMVNQGDDVNFQGASTHFTVSDDLGYTSFFIADNQFFITDSDGNMISGVFSKLGESEQTLTMKSSVTINGQQHTWTAEITKDMSQLVRIVNGSDELRALYAECAMLQGTRLLQDVCAEADQLNGVKSDSKRIMWWQRALCAVGTVGAGVLCVPLAPPIGPLACASGYRALSLSLADSNFWD